MVSFLIQNLITHTISLVVCYPLLRRVYSLLKKSWLARNDGLHAKKEFRAYMATIPLGTLIFYLIIYSIVLWGVQSV
ncbi:MAG: hypothetical protein ACXAD7_02805 [Candidatus Kariarchaeaceae archaeon]